jgi:hypothetical protein
MTTYTDLEQAELKALRGFYMAWLAFHAVNQDTSGDEHFKRKRLERAATKMSEAVAEVRKFDPKVVQ